MRTAHVTLGEDGRLVIPAPLRKELGLRSGDTLVLESDGDTLLLRGYDLALGEAHASVARGRRAGRTAA